MNEIEKPDTPMSVLELFSTSKDSIKLFGDSIIDQVKEGNADPLRIAALTRSMEAIAKYVNDNLKDNQKNEAQKYGDKPFMAHGCEMQYTSVKTDYVYAVCGDPIWNELQLESAKLNEQIKQRQEWLKTMGNPQDVRVGDELVTIIPPMKKTQMGLKVTIK
jgi:hypothetical protein